jgi:hypothetical protein
MDTRDDFHTYRLAMVGDKLEVYVDGDWITSITLAHDYEVKTGNVNLGDVSTETGQNAWVDIEYLAYSPDARVLAFTAAVALVTTLLFALAPAIRATRVDVAHTMKDERAILKGGAGLFPVRVLLAAQILVGEERFGSAAANRPVFLARYLRRNIREVEPVGAGPSVVASISSTELYWPRGRKTASLIMYGVNRS